MSRASVLDSFGAGTQSRYPWGTPGHWDAVLHGELTADGTRIVLIGDSDDWGLSRIAVQIARLTCAWADEGGGMVSVPATWAAVVQLGFTFGPVSRVSWQPGPRLRNWIAAETAWRMTPLPPLPDGLYPPWLKMRDYQEDGAAQIRAAGKFLLQDDPGLGKTVTTICGLEARRRDGREIFPLCIIVPSWDIGDGWAREIAKWAPGWPGPVMYSGPDRLRHLRTGAKILITTYATARRDAADAKGPLMKYGLASVVADELHLIKNDKSLQSRAVVRLTRKARQVIGASGTMITRDTGDAYPMLEALDPGSWPSIERFKDRYCETWEGDYSEKVTGLKRAAEPEFFAIMERSMRRVAKADVLAQLPPKIYSLRRPEIPAQWRAAYEQMEADMLAELPDGGEMSVMSVLAQLTRLSQLASSAADVETVSELNEETGELEDKQVVTLKAPSWKADVVLEILAERRKIHPSAVFTVSRQLAVITGQACEREGYRTGYVMGTGQGITRKTRQQSIAEFQDGKLDVIICTTGAGGTGITLTRAGTVVMMQRPWPLDQAIQPEDRAHRIGSEQWHDHVEIIDVVAKDTVDERVRTLLREKAGQLSQFVRDPRVVRDLLGGIR